MLQHRRHVRTGDGANLVRSPGLWIGRGEALPRFGAHGTRCRNQLVSAAHLNRRRMMPIDLLTMLRPPRVAFDHPLANGFEGERSEALCGRVPVESVQRLDGIADVMQRRRGRPFLT